MLDSQEDSREHEAGRVVRAQSQGDELSLPSTEQSYARVQAAAARGIPIDRSLCLPMLRTAALACGLKSIRQDSSIKANTKPYIFEEGGGFDAGEQQRGSTESRAVCLPTPRRSLCIPSLWHCGMGLNLWATA